MTQLQTPTPRHAPLAPHTPQADRRAARRGSTTTTIISILLILGALILGSLVMARSSPPKRAAEGAGQTGAPTDPRAIDALLEAAQQSIRAGRLGEAQTILAETVKQYPDHQPLRVLYAGLLIEQRRPVEAYEQYVAALAIGPREASIEFAAGTMANLNDRPDLALEHYLAAQTADPTSARYPLYLAQIQRKLNLVDDAKASLLRVVNMQPDNAIAWGTLADIALIENKADLCLQHVAKARQLEPRVATWRLIEARALKRQARPEQALLVMEGMSEIERSELQPARLLAECHAMLGDKEAALRAITGAADRRRDDREVAFEAAIWLEREGQDERARVYATRARMLGDERAEGLLARLADPE